MPKIYGSVTFNKNSGKLICKQCGYQWVPNKEELTDIAAGRKVTCLFCRAMNDIRVGQIIPKNPYYKLGSYVQADNPDSLRGEEYQDKKVDVIHSRCKHSFKAKLIDIRQGNLECPYCKAAERKQITPEISNIPKNTNDKKLVELIATQPKLKENTGNRLPSKPDEKKLGDIYYSKSRIMEMDPSKDVYTIQCIKCGAEETKSLSMLKKAATREKYLTCSVCKSKEADLIALRKSYIGKIYNGLRIEKIYLDDTGAVLCDAVCTQNKRNMNIMEYTKAITSKDSLSGLSYAAANSLHVQSGVPLGDIINRRISCQICGKQKLSESYRLKPYLTCQNMATINKKSRVAKINLDTVTTSDFYKLVLKGSICDFCTAKRQCPFAGKDPRNSLNVISSLVDMQDSLVTDMLQVNAEYPGMFEFKDSDVNNIGISPDKDLLIIKDTYVGRDGKLYKTCKCTKHGTELILSDSEIAEFTHSQCDRTNVYMRFFDIKRNVYLK